ncbi:MAG: glycosyl hydrolase 115 family protein [Clostridia bacterium]|nr:glycosyl hydrolase 115 family protein [Clostridia bacterium]
MKVFDRDNDSYIILECGACEAIRLAARDLQNNLRRLSGKTCGFEITEDNIESGIFIKTLGGGESEAYTVSVDEKNVTVTGTDILGTVFGIYAFATKCLNILPVYRLTDIFPSEREELTVAKQSFSSEERPIRFRGWFLNDEDLLTDWRLSGGKRYIDYPYYQNVMDTDVLDMILECALRMEINLIIPSSFVDIDNPDEEKLVETVCRRGMYISQHHVEPMGVSFFGADNYIKKRGYEGETVSFISNRERMVEIWKHYASKWAKYGDNVVWQLGLRGKADKAVWQNDPSVPMDEASRGAIISDAIATQYDIVRKTLGHDGFNSTATLWMEGAELYGKGYLKIPEGTVAVFSDIGFSQMFGDDFYRIERKSSARYGIYYHVGYFSHGPHLAEGCDLRKMAFSYREAYEKQSLYYSILNVSNVRPLHFSAWVNAEIMRAPQSVQVDEIVDRLLGQLLGEDAASVKGLMSGYYDAFVDMGRSEYLSYCDRNHFFAHDYKNLPYAEYPATDGVIARVGKTMLKGKDIYYDLGGICKTLKEGLPKWEALCEEARAVRSELSDVHREYFDKFLNFEITYMTHLTRWAVACYGMVYAEDEAVRTSEFDTAVTSLCSIIEERKVLEQGDWENWHRGDVKINVAETLRLTEKTYGEAKK